MDSVRTFLVFVAYKQDGYVSPRMLNDLRTIVCQAGKGSQIYPKASLQSITCGKTFLLIIVMSL